MARKQSSGFNKLLNFIGLVDDEDTRDTYGEEYSGDSYGRQAAYSPARQTRAASNSRASASSRQISQRRLSDAGRLPDSGTRSRYESRYDSGSRYESRYDTRSASTSSRAARGYDDYRASERRTESRFDDTRGQRQPSRYSQPDARYAAGGNVPQRATPQRMRVSPRSRTVMYSLHTLEDCCEVIDQLIANNTVVLTMDELDGRLLQRAVDTLSGAVFALHASIRKASDKTYLVAPMSVEINEAYDMDRRF
ncbi:MAG: cell division protein SepF [Clostridia bacterium]|nr:cell division protein SepF [Clostridia bacterium]